MTSELKLHPTPLAGYLSHHIQRARSDGLIIHQRFINDAHSHYVPGHSYPATGTAASSNTPRCKECEAYLKVACVADEIQPCK